MASKVRFVDSNITISPGAEGTSHSAISASYALSASYADYAVSASHEIVKEVSSSYADTASYAITASYALNGGGSGGSGIFTETGSYYATTNDLQVTGSFKTTDLIDISLPSGSAFTIHEPDIDQPNRLDFRFDQGNPMLEISSRSSTSSLYLRSNDTDNGLILDSLGKIKFVASGTSYGVAFTTSGFNPNAPNQLNLGAYNRRWKDIYVNNGDKISFGVSDSSNIDLVSLRHTTGTNELIISGSSDVTLDVKGGISASGDISASRFVAQSGGSANEPSFTFHEDGGTGIYSSGPGDLQFQLAAGGSPEITLSTGQMIARVDLGMINHRIYGVTEISGSNGDLPVGSNLIVDGAITASSDVSSSILSTASFGTYLGDGSQLTNLPETNPKYLVYQTGSSSNNIQPTSGSNLTTGNYSVIGGGLSNFVSESLYATIGGGTENTASAYGVTIGGGCKNKATCNFYSSILGGLGNQALAGYSSIGGGSNNQINSSGGWSTIAGGSTNCITQNYSAIGGGYQNCITGNSDQSVVAGGRCNIIEGNPSDYSIIGGGFTNNINASECSGIFGGVSNTITNHTSSFIIGSNIIANASCTTFVNNLNVSSSITASGTISASSFIGDGSQLTNLPTQDPFPYTGSAIITGSLVVSGSLTISGSLLNTGTVSVNNGNGSPASPYTLTGTQQFILIDPSGGDVTVNMPDAATYPGREIRFKLTQAAGANTVTLQRQGADTIDGATTYTDLDIQYESISTVSDGSTGWFIF
tara:strand:+ start:254 stop:2530 length:2277 start_codon:yes stop_codon:yes gene_type:complete